jgi:hypothetical protein
MFNVISLSGMQYIYAVCSVRAVFTVCTVFEVCTVFAVHTVFAFRLACECV